jgi:hypothetical protein
MTGLRRAAGLVVCVCLVWAGPAGADPVVDWNARTFQVIAAAVPQRPGPSAILDVATVQVAVHDAVQAIERRFAPYHVHILSASGSTAAAVAKAARDVLVARFPTQENAIHTMYTDYLSANGLDGNDPGVFVGQQAAAGIIGFRAGDGAFPTSGTPVVGGTGAGEWRPTAPLFGPMAAPWLGGVRPFTMMSSNQFRGDGPPPLTSNEYTRAFNEVKRLGALVNSKRTPEQTQLGIFYSDNLVALWFRTLRGIAAPQGLSIGDSARLFALASMAAADAIITAWSDKKSFNFWRPITAVQEGNNDGNPRTVGDPTWAPLISTPPYPDYTSGANNLAGAMTRILKRFFRSDKMTFVITSTTAPTDPRTYTRFSDVADDMVEVRIYEGIHFRFADVDARRQGEQVANQAFRKFLRPLHGHDDDDEDDDR